MEKFEDKEGGFVGGTTAFLKKSGLGRMLLNGYSSEGGEGKVGFACSQKNCRSSPPKPKGFFKIRTAAEPTLSLIANLSKRLSNWKSGKRGKKMSLPGRGAWKKKECRGVGCRK